MKLKITPIAIGVFFSLIFSAPIFSQAAVLSEVPQVTLEKVIDLSISQANELKKTLINLKDLSEDQEKSRQEFLDFLDKSLDYYRSLTIEPDGSNVKSLAQDIKSHRDGFYNVKDPFL